jgi:hypothetical protein
MKSNLTFGAMVVAVWLCFSSNTTVAREFGGYECTDDCSGHAAGYRWAEDHAIDDEDGCPLNGARYSFWEGCKAYVEDPSRGADEDDDGEEIEE